MTRLTFDMCFFLVQGANERMFAVIVLPYLDQQIES